MTCTSATQHISYALGPSAESADPFVHDTRSWVWFPGKTRNDKEDSLSALTQVIMDKIIYHINSNENQYFLFEIYYPTISLIHTGPSHLILWTVRHFCINAWHTYAIYQLDMYFVHRSSWKRWFLHSRAVKTRKTHSTASLMHRVKHQGSKGKLQEGWTGTLVLHS